MVMSNKSYDTHMYIYIYVISWSSDFFIRGSVPTETGLLSRSLRSQLNCSIPASTIIYLGFLGHPAIQWCIIIVPTKRHNLIQIRGYTVCMYVYVYTPYYHTHRPHRYGIMYIPMISYHITIITSWQIH